MAGQTLPSKAKTFTLRFRNSEIVLGARVWWVLLLVAVILVISVLVSPSNGWAGLGVGVAAVLGAILGSMFQKTPIPLEYTAQGTSAVRGLLAISQDVEDAQKLATQLAQAAKTDRLRFGLIDVQDRLVRVRRSLHVSMHEWDGVAPGSSDEVSRLQRAGSAMLKRMSEGNNLDE